MNKKYIKGVYLLGLLASIGLSSCQLTNKYKSPDVNTLDLYGQAYNQTDTTTVANLSWKEYFQDPKLQVLIEEGLNKNFDLQIAYTRIKQAEASLSMARAAYFPSVSLVGQVNQSRYSFDKDGKNVLGYHTEKYTLGISAAWELDIWGKLNRQSRSSYAQFLSSQAYRDLVQTSLIANIATSYYSLLALDEQLRITEQTVGLLTKSAETIEALKEAGLQNGAAVEQSKALVYSTQVSIPSLKIQIQQIENSLNVLLGRTPGSIERSTLAIQSLPNTLDYGVPAQMLALRPDVKQAELNFRSAFELTNAAQASFYPSVTLTTGMIGYGTNNTLSQFFKPENLIASLIGGITQPLFAKKQLISQLKTAKANQAEALLTFEQTVLKAGSEVSEILYTYETSMTKNATRNQQIKSLGTAVYYTQELLKAGEANYTEVLTAEQNLLSAQLGQVSDKLEQLQAAVNLYKALGGGTK